jgi:hypothetical protein
MVRVQLRLWVRLGWFGLELAIVIRVRLRVRARVRARLLDTVQ